MWPNIYVICYNQRLFFNLYNADIILTCLLRFLRRTMIPQHAPIYNVARQPFRTAIKTDCSGRMTRDDARTNYRDTTANTQDVLDRMFWCFCYVYVRKLKNLQILRTNELFFGSMDEDNHHGPWIIEFYHTRDMYQRTYMYEQILLQVFFIILWSDSAQLLLHTVCRCLS